MPHEVISAPPLSPAVAAFLERAIATSTPGDWRDYERFKVRLGELVEDADEWVAAVGAYTKEMKL